MQWTRAGLVGAVLVILGLVYGGRSSTGSTKPVVAVVVSGAMRTLPECRKTVVKHIVEANPSMEFHFYVYLTVDTEAEVLDARQLVSQAYPNVKSVLVLNGKQTSKAVRKALPGLDRLPAGSGTARGKASNIAKMLLGISLAERLRSLPSPPVFRHQLPEAGAVGAPPEHSLVLRLRPDLCFCRPLHLSALLGTAAVHVPWSVPGMAFDQIAVGPPALMARYAGAFAVTLPRDVRAGRELYPERALGSHLAAAMVPLRQLRGFHASLARGGGHGGRVSFEDPFGKLRLDLLNASFPAHACATARGSRQGAKRGGAKVPVIRLRQRAL
jgi:hypothetical protein